MLELISPKAAKTPRGRTYRLFHVDHKFIRSLIFDYKAHFERYEPSACYIFYEEKLHNSLQYINLNWNQNERFLILGLKIFFRNVAFFYPAGGDLNFSNWIIIWDSKEFQKTWSSKVLARDFSTNLPTGPLGHVGWVQRKTDSWLAENNDLLVTHAAQTVRY